MEGKLHVYYSISIRCVHKLTCVCVCVCVCVCGVVCVWCGVVWCGVCVVWGSPWGAWMSRCPPGGSERIIGKWLKVPKKVGGKGICLNVPWGTDTMVGSPGPGTLNGGIVWRRGGDLMAASSVEDAGSGDVTSFGGSNPGQSSSGWEEGSRGIWGTR